MTRLNNVLIVATIGLLAGCLEGVPTSDDTVTAPVREGIDFAFSAPVSVPNSAGGESFVAVSLDGKDVFTCNHGDFVKPSPVWVSEDGGTTFRALTVDPSPIVGGDCETAVMDDGTWVVMSSTVVGGTVSTSSDRGKSWITSFDAAPPTNGLADRPWLEAGAGNLYLTFMPLYAEPGFIAFTKSTDKSASWSLPKHITEWDGTKTHVIHGNMQVLPDGKTIFVPLFKYKQPVSSTMVPQEDSSLGFAVSRDAGESWTETVAVPSVATGLYPPTAAVAGDSRLYFAYSVGNGSWGPGGLDGGKMDFDVIVSGDQAKTWSEPVRVASGITQFDIPWIDGHVDGTATLLLQVVPQEIGLEGSEMSVVAFRLDADAPDLVVGKTVVGPGSAEFVTVDHDATGRAYVGYADGAVSKVAVETKS